MAAESDTKQTQLAKTIELDHKGQVQLRDLNQRRRYLDQLLVSGMLPQQYKTVQQVEMAWDLLGSMGLPPLPYLPLVVIVNNRLTVMSDALMAACEQTGQLEWLDIYFLNEKNERLEKGKNEATFTVFCAVVTAKRKGRPEMWARFTLAQARAAGLMRNKVWEAFSEDMLMHRARSRVLRQLFADSIGGVRVKELDEYMAVLDDSGAPVRTQDGHDVMTRKRLGAQDLNKMFGAAPQET